MSEPNEHILVAEYMKAAEATIGHPVSVREDFGDDAWWCENCGKWTPPGHLQCDDCAGSAK